MKIAFFDIDGTLTSEIDGSVPDSAKKAIRKARAAGNLMFLNTGRCFQNVEQRFREVGFDGFVNGCGTHIVIGDETLLYVSQPAERIHDIIKLSREIDVDTLYECRYYVTFDRTLSIKHPAAKRQAERFLERGYDIAMNIDDPNFTCDKFVIWYQTEDQLAKIREYTDQYFECIDRGGTFREFVPIGYSKATGIQKVLDHYNLPLESAYAFGDSNNDETMLSYVKHSVAMGNAESEDIIKNAAHVTTKASEDGIANALKELGFF
jgi:Cof subfamily protein (haloacid dehalogenase superfamily)